MGPFHWTAAPNVGQRYPGALSYRAGVLLVAKPSLANRSSEDGKWTIGLGRK